MTALLIGTALAVASLCFVLYPLFRADISVAPRNLAGGGTACLSLRARSAPCPGALPLERPGGRPCFP